MDPERNLELFFVAVILLQRPLVYLEPKVPANTALLKFTHLSQVLTATYSWFLECYEKLSGSHFRGEGHRLRGWARSHTAHGWQALTPGHRPFHGLWESVFWASFLFLSLLPFINSTRNGTEDPGVLEDQPDCSWDKQSWGRRGMWRWGQASWKSGQPGSGPGADCYPSLPTSPTPRCQVSM